MTQLVLATRELAGRLDPVWMALAIGFAMLALFLPEQAYDTLTFTTDALIGVSIFLLLSIGVAAYAKASGADALIARAFTGDMSRMIIAAALMGAGTPRSSASCSARRRSFCWRYTWKLGL